MSRILSILLFVLALCGCTRAQAPAPAEADAADDKALRSEIGQMLVVGFRGTQLADTAHIVRDITRYNIGGVILFEYDAPTGTRPRNITSPQQLKSLCRQLQNYGGGSLFIGIDQEGGRVTRLKQQYGFPYFASAQKTATDGIDSVRYYARLTATTLADMGINLDFAPCVDVNINPACPVIGKLERSFSADPRKVTRCASVWMDELHARGVTSCLKHFPGHGSSKADTHLGIADVSDSWKPSELTPYRDLIAGGKVRMIMTTHVFNAQIDSLFPATLSQTTLTTLLRDSLHFDGVIITDDLAMGAMTQQYTYEEMLMRAINAGADMLCLSNNGKVYNPDVVPQTIDIVMELVKKGLVSAERIHESAARIAKLKGIK